MNSISKPNGALSIFPRWPLAVLSVLIASLLVAALLPPDFPDYGEDSGQYRDMALGRWELVPQPFSSRFLHTGVVALIARRTGWTVDSAFVAVAEVALPLILVGLAVLLACLRLPVYLILPLVLSAAFVRTVRLVYMPDMFYTLLLIAFLILVAYRQLVLAAAMIVVLFCARESTIVLGLVVAACAVWSKDPKKSESIEPSSPRTLRGRFLIAAMFLLATVIGSSDNRHEAAKVPNIHHLSGLMYFAGKAPYNFFRNVLGIEIWMNTLTRSLGNHPMVSTTLPKWLHLGDIRTIGINDVAVRFPAIWLQSTLCVYGVLFTVVAQSIWISASRVSDQTAGFFRRIRNLPAGIVRLLKDEPFVVQIAGGYGLINIIICPLLGTAVQRYVCYAWPAFWIVGTRLLLKKYSPAEGKISAMPFVALLVIHFTLQWLPAALIPGMSLDGSVVISLLVAVLLHCVAWKLLVNGFRNDGSFAPR